MYCIQEKMCNIVGNFQWPSMIWRLGHCAPSLWPWWDIAQQSAQLWYL